MLCYDQAALRVHAVVAGLCKTSHPPNVCKSPMDQQMVISGIVDRLYGKSTKGQ